MGWSSRGSCMHLGQLGTFAKTCQLVCWPTGHHRLHHQVDSNPGNRPAHLFHISPFQHTELVGPSPTVPRPFDRTNRSLCNLWQVVCRMADYTIPCYMIPCHTSPCHTQGAYIAPALEQPNRKMADYTLLASLPQQIELDIASPRR